MKSKIYILVSSLYLITYFLLSNLWAATPTSPLNFDAEKDLQVELSWTLDGGDNGTGIWEITYTTSTVATATTTTTGNVTISSENVSYVAGSTITYQVSGLIPHLTYYFWVRVRDDADWSSYTSSMSAVAGIFSEISNTGIIDLREGAFDWGDYDNDGDLDLLITGRNSGGTNTSKIYRNDSGSFADISASIEPVDNSDVDWGDFDSDGDLDFVLTGRNASGQPTTKIYRNDNGTFTDISVSLLGLWSSSSKWGDYDNDGDLDLIITGYSGLIYVTKLYRNDGEETFVDIPVTIQGMVYSEIAWFDYDNDSDLDLAMCGYSGSSQYHFKIYRNDSGSFTDLNVSFQGADEADLDFGDYDNDGDLDLVVSGSYNDGSDRDLQKIYRNDSGTFVDSGISIIAGESGIPVFGDYDNDGDLDLFTSGYNETGGDHLTKIYRNDGSDTFTDIQTTIPPSSYGDTAWVDYDSDGDLDCIISAWITSDWIIATRIYKSHIADSGITNTAPNAPSNLTSTLNSGNLEFRWDKATDNGVSPTPTNGLYYEIQVATATITDSLNYYIVSTSTGMGTLDFGNYSHGFVSALQPGLNLNPKVGNATYYFKVRTIDTSYAKSTWATGPSIFLEEVLTTVPSLSNPIDEYATAYNQIDFSWIDSFHPLGIESYELEVSTDITFNYVNHSSITILTSATVTSMVDNSYFWRVRAKNNESNYSNWASTRIAYVAVNTPITPQDFTVETAFQFDFSFTAAGGNNGSSGAWEIRYSTNSSVTFATAEHTTTYLNINYVAGQNYSLESLSGFIPNTTYYFFIRAKDNDGDWSPFSDKISGASSIFEEVTGLSIEGLKYSDLAWGDYDNDGDLDLAIIGQNQGNHYISKIYRNDDGTLTDIGASLSASYAASLSWGDFDADGDLDLAIGGNIARIYKNNNGTFSSYWVLPDIREGSVSWGDYDNDGDLDIGFTGFNYTKIYKNNNGSFVDIGASLLALKNSSLAWGDYDNDGDLDIALVGLDSGNNQYTKIYRNDDGTFVDTNTSLDAAGGGKVIWADYDNDGNLDLIYTGNVSGGLRIYRNDTGSFTRTNTSVLGYASSKVSLADYDNDGDLDLFVLNQNQKLTIYKNTDGSFSSSGIIFPDIRLYGSFTIGDYDNDGDLDIALTGDNASSVRYFKLLGSLVSDSITNTAPNKPTNLSSSYNTESGVASLTWDKPTDDKTATNGLYYDIRVASATIDDQLDKWIVSPSTGAGVGAHHTQTLGNYSHGFVSGTPSFQAGLNLNATVEDCTYYWQVRAIDTGLRKSIWSASESVYVPNMAPIAPILVSPSDAHTTDYPILIFNWNESTDTITGVKDYELEASSDINFSLVNYSSVTVLTFASIDFKQAATYYFRVRARDNLDLYGAFSSTRTFFADVTPPTVPTIIQPIGDLLTNVTSLDFVWNSSTGMSSIANYELKLSSDINFSWIDYSSTTLLTTATISGIAEETFYFRVRAVDVLYRYSAWATTRSFNVNSSTPNAPLNFSAQKDEQVKLTWVLDSGTNGAGVWEIKYTTGTDKTASTAEHTKTVTDVNYIVGSTITYYMTGLIADQDYYFWVRVRDTQDDWSLYTDSQSATSSIFVEKDSLGIEALRFSALEWGDYDNDGDLDLAIAGYSNSSVRITRVYRNDSGTFTLAVGLPGVTQGALAWGDYDNDGDLDLVVSGHGPSTQLYRNDNGAFTAVTTSFINVYDSSVDWGDYDNDGDLDLVLAGYTGSVEITKIYRNDAGSFTDINASLAGVSKCRVKWGDYDNDGDVDLAVCGGRSGWVAGIYRNDSGTFVSSGSSLDAVRYGDLAWGDYDNDGDLDLAVLGSGNSKIYRNDSGSFVDSGTTLTALSYCSLAWGDYDNDGDLDLLTAGSYGTGDKYMILYSNNGNGTFTSMPGILEGIDNCKVAFGDYDNDGDLDTIISGNVNGSSTGITKLYDSMYADAGIVNAAPNVPTNLTSTLNSGKIEFRWDKATDNGANLTPDNGLYYEIAVATENITSSLDYYTVSPTTAAGTNNFGNYAHGFVSALQPGLNLNITSEETTYYFQARTIDTGLKKSLWSTPASIYAANQAPTAPILVAPIDSLLTNSTTLTFEWSASTDVITGVKDYELQISSSISFSWIDYSSTTVFTSATISGIENQIYYFRVRAKDNSDLYGDYSSTRTFIVTPIETPLYFTACTDLQIKLSWVANNGLDNTNAEWEIKYTTGTDKTASTAEHTAISSTNINYVQGSTYTYRLEDLTVGQTYYFWLRARISSESWTTPWTSYTSSMSAVANTYAELETNILGLSRSDVSWCDYDNDNDADIAILGYDGLDEYTKIYRNNAGTFEDIGASLTGVQRGALSWGDYDNDGDADLVVTGRDSLGYDITKIYRNDAGTFVDIGATVAGVTYGSVSWGDYDNDGDLDLLIVGDSIGKIYKNTNGTFTDTGIDLGAYSNATASWGDYDNDGDLDIAVAGRYGSGQKFRILRNDGDGLFNSITVSEYHAYYSSLAWGDYDSDGDLDIIVGGRDQNSEHICKLYRNDGSDTFTDTGKDLGGLFNGATVWGDYDNDGDLDIVLAGKNEEVDGSFRFMIYKNDSGNFSDSGVSFGFDDPDNCRLSLGDYDNDGDLDVAFIGYRNQANERVMKIFKSYEADSGNPNAAPSAPTGLDRSYDENNILLQFTWNKATDAETSNNSLYYDIQVATEPLTDSSTNFIISASSGIGTGIGQLQNMGNYPLGYVSSNQPGVNLHPPVSDATYYWRVRTIDNGLKRSAWAVGTSTYIGKVIPTTPVLSSPLDDYATNYNQITFKWGESVTPVGISNYELDLSTDINFGVINYSSITVTTGAIISSIADNDYWWRVRSKDADSEYSAWTTTRTFAVSTNNPLSPYDFQAQTDLQIKLTFTAQGGTNGTGQWDIRYSTEPSATSSTAELSFSSTNVSYVTGSDYEITITTLVPNSTYYFFIRARDGNGNWSSFTDKVSSVAGIFEHAGNLGIDIFGSDQAMSLGDYDSDGDLDVFVTNMSFSKIYRNDSGIFNDAGVTSIIDLHDGYAQWGDFDNDGDLDLAIMGYVSGTDYRTCIYKNDAGNFVLYQSLLGLNDGALAWGDYDNDGDLDIVITGLGLGNPSGYTWISKIYKNHLGEFVDIGADIKGGSNSSASWGDYDNDGDLDLTLMGKSDGSPYTKIYRNDNGSFTDSGISLVQVYQGAFAWGDYDNDGDLDLALTGHPGSNPQISKIYRNDAGTFVDSGASIAPVGVDGEMSWGDYDADGYLDLVVSGRYFNAEVNGYRPLTKIYKNNSGSSFSEYIVVDDNLENPQISWFDYDNDSDLDLILMGFEFGVSVPALTKIFKSNYSQIKTNTAPNAPSNLSSSYDSNNAKVTFQWDKATDNESANTGLYYEIQVATQPVTDSLDNYIVSASTGKGLINFGNYPHGLISAGQPGLKLNALYGDLTYYYRVRTIDTSYDRSTWISGPSGVYVSEIKPTTCTIVSPIDNLTTNQRTVTFDWTAAGHDSEVIGIDHYELLLSTDINFSAISYSSNTSLTLVTLNSLSDATYYYKIKVYDELNYTNESSTQRIIIDATKPTVVTNIIPLDQYKTELSSITFSWDASSDASGIANYDVYISSDIDFGNIDYSSNTVLTTATISNLGIETLYFKIRAKDNVNTYSDWSQTRVLHRVGALPPVNFKGVALSTHTIAWSWENVSTKATGYGVGGVTTTLANNATYYEETELSANKDYTRYAESYYNTDGSTETSNNATVFTLANAPSGLSPSEIKKHSVILSWSGNGGKNYMIEQKEATGSWEVVVGTVTEVTKKITHLKPGTTYYFSVKAKNGDDIVTESSSTYKVVTLNVPGSRLDPTKENKEERDVKMNGKDYTVKVTIPSGAVNEVVYITVGDPITNPVEVDSSTIVEADTKIEKGKKSLGLFLELNMYTLIGDKVGSFAKKVTIEFPYSDVNQDGIIDGTKIPEESVEIYVLNETSSEWELVGGVVDTLANVVIAELSHFSVYTLISKKLASDNLDNVKVYPNPYKVGTGGKFDRPGGIMFKNLTAKANIRIYNIVGKLVYEYAEENGDGEYEWDGTNTYGKNLASGIYIYIIKNPEVSGDKAKGKLGIIR